jgi:chromosome partitioning protein
MKNLPRVLSGRCKVGAIAMRMDNLNTGVTQMRAWADGLGVPMIGALGDHPIYVECAEQGLTIFDRPAGEVADDLKEWQPILDWLEPVLNPVVESPVLSSPRLEQAERPVPPKSVLPSSSPSLRPQTPLPPLSATTVLGAARAPSSSTLGVSALPPNTWASRTLGALRPGGVLGGGANKVAAPSAEAGPSETAPASGSLIPRFLQRPEAK